MLLIVLVAIIIFSCDMNLKVIQIGALRFFVHIETVYGGTLNLYLKGIALIRINNSGVHVLSAWQLLQISRFIIGT